MMSAADKVFTGSIPEVYDTHLVPLIFEAYAVDLARRVLEGRPEAVLETAAGSGVVPRALGPLLDANTRYVVSDLNQPMLDRAIRRHAPDNTIVWQQADALALPFEDKSFDTVCCQFGVMFFPDRIAGYRQSLRVLRPGGRFLFSVWDRIEHNDFARVVTEAAAEIFPNDPPMFLSRTPHGYSDIAMIERDLRSAGFSMVQIETSTRTSTAPSPCHAAIAYCQGTPLRNEIESREPGALDKVTSHAAEQLAKIYGNAEVSGKIQAHVIEARV
jgi:ubiquinone/menaquinone biosynthesis C-methylase UbiE